VAAPSLILIISWLALEEVIQQGSGSQASHHGTRLTDLPNLQVRSAKLSQKLRSSCPTGIRVSRAAGKGAWTPLASKELGLPAKVRWPWSAHRHFYSIYK